MAENVHYLRLQSGDTLPNPNHISPFKAVVIIEDVVEPDWQNLVSEWLVGSGCRYMMAWGLSCFSWDDTVDFANLEQFDFGDIPDEHFVMTTWHEDETLADVVNFAKNTAKHPTLDLRNFLFLHIGPQDRRAELVSMYSDI